MEPIGNNMAVQVLKHEYELLIRFEEEAYDLWGLYQQAVVGNVNVPSGSLVSLQKARVWSSLAIPSPLRSQKAQHA